MQYSCTAFQSLCPQSAICQSAHSSHRIEVHRNNLKEKADKKETKPKEFNVEWEENDKPLNKDQKGILPKQDNNFFGGENRPEKKSKEKSKKKQEENSDDFL
jgi:hypothetical protein